MALTLLPAVARSQPYDNSSGSDERPTTAFRFGADLGYGRIEGENYLVANATGLIRVGPFRSDFWVPLRFNLSGFRFRVEDWDTPRDWMRLGRCIRIDVGDYTPAPDRYDPSCDAYSWQGHGLHDRTYFNARLTPLQHISFGNATLVDGFRTSIDPDNPQLGIHTQFDLRDWLYLRGVLDDVTNPHVMGAHFGFRPLQTFAGQNWDETPDDLDVGVSFVSDVQAPRTLWTALGRPIVDNAGNLRFTTQSMSAFSANIHYLYLWGLGDTNSATRTGLFIFTDYNRFLEIPDADGLHAGARFVFRDRRLGWEFRAGAEFRWMGNRYIPSYFDTNYGTASQRFVFNNEARQQIAQDRATGMLDPSFDPIFGTRIEYLLARPDGRSYGLQAYMQAIIPIPTGSRSGPTPLPITAYVEDASGPANASASLVVGPFRMDQLIVAGQYLRRNFNDLSGIFSLDGSLFRLVGRLYFGSSQSGGSQSQNILRNLALDVRFDRRYYLDQNGSLQGTNDFVATLGFIAGST